MASFFKKIYERQRGAGKEIIHLLVIFPEDCKTWVTLKLGVRNSILVYHRGGRVPSTWAIIHRFPRHINKELVLKWSSHDLNNDIGCWCCEE